MCQQRGEDNMCARAGDKGSPIEAVAIEIVRGGAACAQ